MYSTLKIRRTPTNTPIDDVEQKLHNLGHIEWVNLPGELENRFKNSPTPDVFLRMLFYLNHHFLSKRFSNRYQKFVNFGKPSRVSRTSRSVIDMFLIAKQYCPQYANLRLLYEALMQMYCNDSSIKSIICHDVKRRVWHYSKISADLNTYLNAPINSINLSISYSNGELLKTDELGTKIHIDLNCDPPYRMEYVESKNTVVPDGKLGVINPS